MINLNYLEQSQLIYNQTNLSFYNTLIINKKLNMSKNKKNKLISKKIWKNIIFLKCKRKKHNVKNLITTFKFVNHTFVSVNI